MERQDVEAETTAVPLGSRALMLHLPAPGSCLVTPPGPSQAPVYLPLRTGAGMALRSSMVSCRVKQGPVRAQGGQRHLRTWALQSEPQPGPRSLRVHGAEVKGYPCPMARGLPCP